MLPGNSRWVLVESLANPTAGKGERKSRRAADLPPGWTAEEAAAHAEEQEFKHRQPIVCDLLAGPMLAYPTLSELGKRAAGEFYAGRLFSPAVHRLVRVLRWFG